MQAKQKIYEVAKILYIREGYYKVSNKRLAEESGVNQGLITYYFKNKSNIAAIILREIYQIQISYLKNHVDVHKDPFLFNISADNLMSRLIYCSKDMTRFISEMIKERIILDNVYEGGQKNDLMIMIKALVPDSKENLNKHFRKFVAMTFPVAMEFQLEIWNGLDMSYEEYFETMVGLFVYGLDLPLQRKEWKKTAERSNEIVLEIMETHPHLKDPETYLFNRDLFQPSLVEQLLDLT
ncbi:helix-turn-helix transcriptional regulator [Alkalibacter rhizosphaerae]|uniref:Helix-turn-helix transcriptional regulator n=1 Tax=Alkalibacter rhizosphaerae TaxID=2815577 RepID=A0A974XG11_9FIRM|nr:TetR/AcrR family transcriptional regulator [Alkalibacter rhizosphaerae]QSX09182.1 helix-turn-helix transcriptional regulator [Alkalibacter rhizosphaerae]